MNKTITIYELLGLIKDGKAPKKIEYQGNYLEFDGEDYKYYKGAETLSEDSLVKYIAVGNLNDTVEILEEDKPIIEKINGGIITSRAVYTNFNDVFKDMSKSYETIDDIIIKLNEVIDYINRKEDK